MFVYHRLGKLDTLAGLAIRYGVTVSDLKRANGLHSEMGMFALRELKVPKGQLPASHAGFQALLSQRRTPPEISTEASSALDKLRSHYGTGRLLPEAGGEAVAGGEGGGGAGAGGAASAGGSATTSGRGAGEADVGTAGGSRLGSEEVAAVVLREAAEQLERQKLVSVKDISAEKGGDPGGPLSLKKRGSNGELAGGGGGGGGGGGAEPRDAAPEGADGGHQRLHPGRAGPTAAVHRGPRPGPGGPERQGWSAAALGLEPLVFSEAEASGPAAGPGRPAWELHPPAGNRGGRRWPRSRRHPLLRAVYAEERRASEEQRVQRPEPGAPVGRPCREGPSKGAQGRLRDGRGGGAWPSHLF